jgi:hypothetical protein
VIIFGTRIKQKKLGEGHFFCPRCQAQRKYVRHKASRYFALYFIPVVPLGQVGEFIACQTCGTAFEPAVLTQKIRRQPPGGEMVALINAVPSRLRAGMPAEYITRDLTAAGLDRDAALALVEPHLAGGSKTCETCGLTYSATVDRCTECAAPL